MKNIYAIAAGLADGLGVGQNTRALLITRSLLRCHACLRTWAVTPELLRPRRGWRSLCDLSFPAVPQFQVGKALAEGQTLQTAEADLGQVAEGSTHCGWFMKNVARMWSRCQFQRTL